MAHTGQRCIVAKTPIDMKTGTHVHLMTQLFTTNPSRTARPTAKSSTMQSRSLSEELKETLRLYYRDGYSTKEIASLKGVGESSIRARLHRARKKIAAALACVITASALLFGSVVLPMHQIPEAHAIDFATDTSASLDDLPVKAIQNTGDGKASVTFEANLTWSITGIERVTYNTNAENTKLYSPGIGNYYT